MLNQLYRALYIPDDLLQHTYDFGWFGFAQIYQNLEGIREDFA